jgi:hypothetical protein
LRPSDFIDDQLAFPFAFRRIKAQAGSAGKSSYGLGLERIGTGLIEGLGTEKISITLADSDSPKKLSARGFNMYFIAHVKAHALPPSHELEAMIAARHVPRKFIGLARRARAALDEAEALPDGDARREALLDEGDDIEEFFLGLEQ